MKIIVAGSRDINDPQIVFDAIKGAKHKLGWEFTELVTGMARGPDRIAYMAATRKGLKVEPFPVPGWVWDKVGKRAGYLRNEAMADYADALIAVWDGESRATSHMIDIAYNQGLPVWVCRTDNWASYEYKGEHE